MLNISPIGRNCSRPERNDYEKFDLENNIRKSMVAAMQEEFKDLNLTFSIGGQISFDVFPTGWDKTYCLKFINAEDYDEIHFFGVSTTTLFLPPTHRFPCRIRHSKVETTLRYSLTSELLVTLLRLQMTRKSSVRSFSCKVCLFTFNSET